MTNKKISLKGFIILDRKGDLWSKEIYFTRKDAVNDYLNNNSEDPADVILDIMNNEISIVFASIEISYPTFQQEKEPTREF